MSEQPQTGSGTEISAADLEPDGSSGARPASSDPDAFTDDGLGTGDGPTIQDSADGAS